jgi:hypothetical protein
MDSEHVARDVVFEDLVLQMKDWRFFFAEEGNEPIHLHCKKGDAKAIYWLDTESFEITESHAKGMSPADKRNVRKIIFDHFEYLVAERNSFKERKNGW